jgi:hypothetical protein
MTPDEVVHVNTILDSIRSWEQEAEVRAEKRLRLRIESELAIDQLHQAVVALKAARPLVS